MYLIDKIPVFPSSYAEIELECFRFLQLKYPENITRTVILDVFSLEDTLFGYKLEIDDRIEGTNIEGYTDFINKVIYVPLKTYDALVRGNRNNRERFTAVHEAGHVILHRRYFETQSFMAARSVTGKIKPYMDPEWQANAAAGALLMPLSTFFWENKALEQSGGFDSMRIAVLSNKFQVSEDAVERRLRTFENEGIKDLIRRLGLEKSPRYCHTKGFVSGPKAE
jgi:Zn-dependent peptidase ImmA (M78 family)